MPFINNEHLYANPKPESAYTQGSIDLMAPTIPLPQAHPNQINGQDIALITLTAILVLVSGAAIIRLIRLLSIEQDAPSIPTPKSFTESSSSLPIPTLAMLQTSSVELYSSDLPSEKTEQHLTTSFSFARPESPLSPKCVPAFMREEEEEIIAMLSIRAGEESVCRRGHREKKESESSTATTVTTVLDSLCSSAQRSSVTSVHALSTQSELDENEEEELEEAEVYEVKRVQTQSMEVKRGVLMSWRTSRPPSPIPELPTVVISESGSDPGALDRTFVLPGDDTLLQALPSLLVTHPSDISLVSTSSSISVDLDEFPLPPTLPKIDSGDTSLQLVALEADGRINQTSKEKRSTVDQVITMYE